MKIGVVGCAGRMGKMVIEAALAAEGCTLAGGTEAPGHAALGADLGTLVGRAPLGATVLADAAALFQMSDAVIDFTSPKVAVLHADLAAKHGTALVLGTTGLGKVEQDAVVAASKKAAIVQAANFSIGVNVLLGLVRQAASILGPEYDVEVVEMHHRHKVDAPSGTALALGQAAADGRAVDLGKTSVRTRDGHTGARRKGDIGFATLRGGDVVGDHTVMFAGEGERVEITHKASSRGVFAAGAVRAAQWAAGKPAGLYSMRDVLGFSG